MYERSVYKPPCPNRAEPHRHLGRFPRHSVSVRDVREWLRRRMNLRSGSAQIPVPVAEDALLITSEITTNALLHTPNPGQRGAFVVSAFFYTNCLRISIRNNTASQVPVPHLQELPPTPDAEHGRGLAIVNALATTWGTEPARQGPAVYFTLDWSPVTPNLSTKAGRQLTTGR